jgi:tRNA(fMet)-specific endonuclease VapC
MANSRGYSVIYLLDTNVCVRFLNGRAPNVRLRMMSVPKSQIAVCSIVKAELWHGALKSQVPARTRARQDVFLANFVSLPFDDVAAQQCANIRVELAAQPIGPFDALIASIALANDLTLVTRNTREFGRISGLKLDDWE